MCVGKLQPKEVFEARISTKGSKWAAFATPGQSLQEAREEATVKVKEEKE